MATIQDKTMTFRLVFVVVFIVRTYSYIIQIIKLTGIHHFHKTSERCIPIHIYSYASVRSGYTDLS